MIKDLELTFAKEAAVTAATAGTLGSAVDLGTERALFGRQSYIVIESLADMTATG